MYLMEGEPIMNYQNFNAKTIDSWCDSGWEWGKSITHEEYENAKIRKMECAFNSYKICST